MDPPHLRPGSVAVIQLHRRPVARRTIADIQTLAQRLHRAVGLHRPRLRVAAVTAVDLHRRAVRAAGRAHIHTQATKANDRASDRAGRSSRRRRRTTRAARHRRTTRAARRRRTTRAARRRRTAWAGRDAATSGRTTSGRYTRTDAAMPYQHHDSERDANGEEGQRARDEPPGGRRPLSDHPDIVPDRHDQPARATNRPAQLLPNRTGAEAAG